LEEQKKQEEAQKPLQLIAFLKQHKITVGQSEFSSNQFRQIEKADPADGPFAKFGVKVDHDSDSKKDALVFRVLFAYDDFQQTDIIQEFHEYATFEEVLSEMLPPNGPPLPFAPPEVQHKYTLSTIKLFYWDQTLEQDTRFCEVQLGATLGETMRRKDYLLPAEFMPVFHVLAADSPTLEKMKIKKTK